MNKYTVQLVIAIFILLTSCQSAREVHYIKQGENYYRIKVYECAFLSSSRYVSGYFDENAIDSYFGEIKRPDSASTARAFVRVNTNGCSTDSTTKLLLILSTNANAVTEQIAAFAENERTLEIIARLSNKDKIIENNVVKNDLTLEQNKQDMYFNASKMFIENIKADNLTDSAQFAQSYFLPYLNRIAALKGKTTSFSTIAEAQEWFNNEFNKYK